jgi:hypothetical protein
MGAAAADLVMGLDDRHPLAGLGQLHGRAFAGWAGADHDAVEGTYCHTSSTSAPDRFGSALAGNAQVSIAVGSASHEARHESGAVRSSIAVSSLSLKNAQRGRADLIVERCLEEQPLAVVHYRDAVLMTGFDTE